MTAAPPGAVPPAELEQLGLADVDAGRPGDLRLVVLRDPATGDRVIASLSWGLVTGSPGAAPVLHIPAETIAARGTIREAFRRWRCIVPMDGYVQRGSGHAKDCFEVSLADGALMAIAAIWREAADGPGFAIVTCAANEAVGTIHERMPVILEPEAWLHWLADGLLSPLAVWELLKPCPSSTLRIRLLPKARRPQRPRSVAAQLELMAPGATLVQPGRAPRKMRAAQPSTTSCRNKFHAMG
jgi:putative SOS response-associated peptidase YedK